MYHDIITNDKKVDALFITSAREDWMRQPDQASQSRVYSGDRLDRIAFPMGGIGAGMICLSGSGGITQVSIRGIAEVVNEPFFAAVVGIKGATPRARVLEGPVPSWKPLFPWGSWHMGSGNGAPTRNYGLPRFSEAEFEARFPFAHVRFGESGFDLAAEIRGWSPFVPGDEDASSLPVAAVEYRLTNVSAAPVEAAFSFHAANLLSSTELTLRPKRGVRPFRIEPIERGFVLRLDPFEENPLAERSFAVWTDDPATRINCRWFRGDSPVDPWVMIWRQIVACELPENPPVDDGGRPSAGASLGVPLVLAPGESKTIRLHFAWYVPRTGLREGQDPVAAAETACDCDGQACEPPATHRAWYTGAFRDIGEVVARWSSEYDELDRRSRRFTDAFYDSSLPPEIVEAAASSLGILKTPTVLRQTDGRLWMWEGCFDDAGCCPGSCTHVWNYAQALPHLFPRLERGLRDTEFGEAQDESGHQQYRVSLPIRPTGHDFHAASDGQLGGLMKVFREWRISGDESWLRHLWPRLVTCLEYCIETWDPRHVGVLEEPHHNTYDIEFWGPDSMTSSFYLGALKAMVAMGAVVGADTRAYQDLYDKGRAYLETELWNGEYFVQKVQWKGLRAPYPPTTRTVWSTGTKSPEALELMAREGPHYQYGDGCLADGVIGQWMAETCGIGEVLDPVKVESHLLSVYRYNFKRDLSGCANPNRPSYAFGREGGLLLCTWPRGGEPTMPFGYAFEVWTGIEYQVASHLAMLGHYEQARDIVRTARARYDGRVRNPFDEIECGHWYGRALASYALLQGFSGARYDAVDKTLHLGSPASGDCRSFLSTATGFGVVGFRNGEPFCEVVDGVIEIAGIIVGSRPVDPVPIRHHSAPLVTETLGNRNRIEKELA
jgi:uncharacterized protein (DUF608 family)